MTNHIKTLLPNLLKKRNNWKWTLLATWPDVIGDLCSKVTLEQVKDDTLVLGVYDSCWLQELYMLSPVLLASINEKLDQPRIKQLRFKRTVRKKQQKKETKKEKRTQKEVVKLTKREQNILQQMVDPELAKVLEAFRTRCHRENS